MLLTPHFTIEELAYTSNKEYKKQNLEEANKQIGNMYMLAGFAERVREIVGGPLTITSGYRCEKLNKKLGGAISSQHTKCEAIDFISKGLTTDQIACKIAASDLKFRQLIIEHGRGTTMWVHVSIGENREILRYKNGKYTTIGELL